MIYLLDVNVLIALLDRSHIHHSKAHKWFAAKGQHGWATSPIIENGVLRIVGNPRFPQSPGSPAVVATVLSAFIQHAGHVFWPDDISILDATRLDPTQFLTPSQLTDSYLLALARAHAGMLATMDRHLSTAAVYGGAQALELI